MYCLPTAHLLGSGFERDKQRMFSRISNTVVISDESHEMHINDNYSNQQLISFNNNSSITSWRVWNIESNQRDPMNKDLGVGIEIDN